jgi:glycosyltransferase involved in cell wall biosynthesis
VSGLRILFVTDAWHPQINGVVRTLSTTGTELEALGHAVAFVGPDRFRTFPLPTYPEIRIALTPGRRLLEEVERFEPTAIHIATEGPLGWAARGLCQSRKWRFSTSYHTRFPEYVAERAPVPLSVSYAVLRHFHANSSALMVATNSIERELAERGFANLRRWTRGVDIEQFRPRNDNDEPVFEGVERPIALYVGRVAVEKNIEAFLEAKFKGTKIVVGDGPLRAELARKYPDAKFLGAQHGDMLARTFAAADVFVFPSKTDTFGLVMLEALASGVPVAAYPVAGPIDVLGDTDVACLHDDLGFAIEQALAIPRERCRTFALAHSWRASAEQFLANLQPCA